MFSKNCDTHTVSYLFVAFDCRLRDNDDFDDRDEFPIFNSNHASLEEDMAANLFVLKYCAREYSRLCFCFGSVWPLNGLRDSYDQS